MFVVVVLLLFYLLLPKSAAKHGVTAFITKDFVWKIVRKIDIDYLIGFHHDTDEFVSHSPVLSSHKSKRSAFLTTRSKNSRTKCKFVSVFNRMIETCCP